MMFDRLRCFKRLPKGKIRNGLWVMEDERVGAFFHGDRNEVQTPRYRCSTLEKWTTEPQLFDVEEISVFEAMEMLKNWPEVADLLRQQCEKHARQQAC